MHMADYKIYYEQYGVGEDLVLIAGFTADHTVWSEMVPYLSKFYRVLVFDNPGAGRSFIPDGDYSLQTMSHDIINLLDHLKIKTAKFMGHSMGAALLMQICIDYTDRVNKAVLCGGTSCVPITARLQIQGLKYAIEHGFSDEYVSLSILPWLYGREFFKDKKRVEKLKSSSSTNKYPQTLKGFRAQAQMLFNYDLFPSLQKITVKPLIIASDEDLLIPMHCADILKNNIPNARFEIIGNGVGHMFHVEEPSKLSQLALNFFSST
jgi:3-oxoadipate enol-lactonase